MKKRFGFTLIEVVVVIGIIAILTVIIFPSISDIRKKNRDTERVADLATLQLGLSLYYNQHQNSVDPEGNSADGNPAGYPKSLEALVELRYVPNESILDPNGFSYEYVPLKRSNISVYDKCTYYHLGAQLELPSAQVDSADQFNSTLNNLSPATTITGKYYHCGSYSGPGIDGAVNSTMYSVHP
jgi:prepilin-type N-terminal cleavage/methylation domain-containing protein